MSVEGLQVNNVGVTFRVLIKENGEPVDISGATSKYIELRKPSKQVLTLPADFTNSGQDGLIQWTSVYELNEIGTWTIQAIVNISGGVYNSSKDTFKVFSNV